MSHTSERSSKLQVESAKIPVPSVSVSNLNIKDLCTKRSSIKGRITKYKNYLNTFFDPSKTFSSTDISILNQRFQRFEELCTTFDDIQSEIELFNSSNLDSELDIRDEMELDFSTLIARTRVFLDANQPHENNFSSAHSESNSCQHSNDNHVGFKLPVIKINNFNGTYFKWLEFRDTFMSLIHNNNKIEDVHKFHYLNSYLEGEAALVISNLEVSSANYKEAWHLLCERYNNEDQLIDYHFDSLLNFQNAPRESSKALKFIIDHVSKNLRALNTLGEPIAHWDSLIIRLVLAKLDNSSKFKWQEHRKVLNAKPSLKDFFQFLKNRADIIESVRVNKVEHHSNNSSNSKPEKSHAKAFAVSAAPGSSAAACVFCGGSHRIYDCSTFLAKSVEDRKTEAVRLKLCINCLRKGHSSRQCRLGPCTICKKYHNGLLHRQNTQTVNVANVQPSTSVTDVEVQQDSCDGTNNVVNNMSLLTNNCMLLSTAIVDIYNPVSKKHFTVRALLDSGSQCSLITDRLKNKLQLTSQPTSVDIIGVGNMTLSNAVQRCTIHVKSKHSNYDVNITCLVLPHISGSIPNKSIDISQIKLPSNIKLADPTFNISAPIDLLIGTDIFWSIIESTQISLGPNQPIMRKTKLGWILAGPLFSRNQIKSKSVQCNHVNFTCTSSNCISNKSLNERLTDFWKLEQIPSSSVVVNTEEEIQCEKDFVTNTFRSQDGRFNVKLPLLSQPDCLGDSYKKAKRQFFTLEKRFSKNPMLKQMYCDFIKEYSDLGHLSPSCILVPEHSYFIPHHAVLKPTSESTKLRVVFNGSAKTSSGFSINDIQMTGPHIQDSLFNILLRFRQHTYVLSGDVEKMYRQVQVQECHRNLQMIIWRDHDTDPLKSLRLNTVTYGLKSSSFLSTRCLWQLGDECSDSKIKNIIQNDFLVDDLLTGSDCADELLHIKLSVENALSKGCFYLRKYRSNLPNILPDNSSTQSKLILSSSSHTLGVGWDPNDDYIHFPNSYENNTDKPTKRSILSDTCKVFDPLGLLSPLTIKPKILIQKLWVQKIDWDEPAPYDICKSWYSFIENMKHLYTLRIPRHTLCRFPVQIEMHCFCDASQSAYAACIYLRSVDRQGNVIVRLQCAKARVASVKPTTIPRLELCACLLGAQLADALCRALRCVIQRRMFWTDSSIALTWLASRYDKLETFVANRVGTILELTQVSDWRHVPTASNPADLASRGVDADKINNLSLWWNGPTFLTEPESFWPSRHFKKCTDIDFPEINVNNIVTQDNGINKQQLIDFNRYSNLKFLQRSFAYVLRFIFNCRNSQIRKSGILQPEELSASFVSLVRLAQQELFSREIAILSSKGILSSKSPLLCLNPFIDENYVLRVGGRLESSCYSFEKRHPMLLHKKHRLTKLLFEQEHLRLLHAGPQLLLSSVRDFVWPIAGRDLARTTARHCVVCRRASGKTLTPMMGALPPQRVNPDFPFTAAGVDFAGPFLITDRKGRGCKITKCYLCVFVCLRFKCLHLEAVSELSTDAFLLSLRRFISRRGKPVEIFCDNGRNFLGASKEIGNFLTSNSNKVNSFLCEEGINFRFQPAYAPHFGGLWEAGVKSAKFHLRRILGNTHLTFEELATLFSQVEAILNSRPLYPLSSSPDDLQTLTPGHFLIGRPLMSLPSPSFSTSESHGPIRDRYKHLEVLRQHFWNRWQLEYIAELQQRVKWRIPDRQLQIGELVLIKEENTPPMNWKLGRILTLYPGKDNVARVADVKTTTGTYRRAIKNLCPLLEPSENLIGADASKAPQDVAASKRNN